MDPITAHVVIDRPREEIFEYLADIANHPEFCDHFMKEWRLTRVESRLEGDMDVRGALGLSDEVRNGYEQIRVTFHIEGDADDETLRGIVEQSRRRSAVYDVLTNPTPVVIDVVTG